MTTLNHCLDLLAFNCVERHRLHKTLGEHLLRLTDAEIEQMAEMFRRKVASLVGMCDDLDDICKEI